MAGGARDHTTNVTATVANVFDGTTACDGTTTCNGAASTLSPQSMTLGGQAIYGVDRPGGVPPPPPTMRFCFTGLGPLGFGLSDAVGGGVFISEVNAGGAADQQGMRVGCLVLELANGIDVRRMSKQALEESMGTLPRPFQLTTELVPTLTQIEALRRLQGAFRRPPPRKSQAEVVHTMPIREQLISYPPWYMRPMSCPPWPVSNLIAYLRRLSDASRAIFGDGQDGMPPEITSCCRDDIELMRGVSSSSSSGPGIRGASAVPAGSGQLLVATPLSPFDHDLPVGTVTLVNPLVKPLVKPPVVAVAEAEAVGEATPVQPASAVIPMPSADLETRRDLETISMPSADLETLLAKAREEARDIHRDSLETLLTQARQEAREGAAAAAQLVARQTMEAQSQMLALIAEQHALLLKSVGESTSKLSQRLDSLEQAPSRAPGTTSAAPSEALPWALGDRSVSVAEAAPATVSDGSGGGGGEGGGGGGGSRGDGGGRSGSTAADVHPVWSDIFMPDDAR